jgi:hypothetical protein
MSVETEARPSGRKPVSPMESAFNIIVFLLFAALWIGFAWALIASQGSLEAAWQWIQGLPLILQGVVWLLFLPVVAGLWIWESAWPAAVRLVLVLGVGFFNLYLFFPGYLFKR